MTGSESGVSSAATVRWEARGSAPSLTHPIAPDGQVDAFWGLLFGLSFYVPLLSAATFSPPARTTIHKFAAVGISGEFMNKIRDRVRPSTNTVFAVAPHDVAERLQDEVLPLQPDEFLSAVMQLGRAFTVEDLFDSEPNESRTHARLARWNPSRASAANVRICRDPSICSCR
ncbi:hypothetical protein ASG88_19510 [Nocardioides sp. Soil777]|uniref:DUF1269 domain-containing protein n=1 Tax=Nocardioides sp. Soil777 TaxID=1736409 RepID=UPI000702A52A|nr:DUF1269 domain-containing protein [Nocardioides sp. Soil777]KRF06697.1 hypothetical protein ASG88_19510 [Nocardioides sp. Soil777]